MSGSTSALIRANLGRCERRGSSCRYSVALLLQRGESARTGFTTTELNADDVAELCTRLDGLPLALELAAARLSLLSPRGILDRLVRLLDLLRSTTPGGVGGFTLDAAEQVAGDGELDVPDGVECLLSTSLLRPWTSWAPTT